jgi:hypothetical protein
MNNPEYICPVPKDQRPLNEYKKLKESSNFFWCIQDKKSYFKSLFYMCLSSLLFCFFVLQLSSFPVNNINFLFLSSVLAAIILVIFLCLRSYLGWQYIYSRLMEATVPYEESGWYDGQIWIKPPEVLLQDRLIGTYEIYPGLLRLQFTLIFLSSLFFTGVTLMRNA